MTPIDEPDSSRQEQNKKGAPLVFYNEPLVFGTPSLVVPQL